MTTLLKSQSRVSDVVFESEGSLCARFRSTFCDTLWKDLFSVQNWSDFLVDSVVFPLNEKLCPYATDNVTNKSSGFRVCLENRRKSFTDSETNRSVVSDEFAERS